MDSKNRFSSSLKRQNDLMNRIDTMTGYSVDYDMEPVSQSIGASSLTQNKLDPRRNTTEHIEMREAMINKGGLLAVENNRSNLEILLKELKNQKVLIDRYRDEIEEKENELQNVEKNAKQAMNDCGKLTETLEDVGNKLIKAKGKKNNLKDLVSNQKKALDMLKDKLDEAEEKNNEIEDDIKNKEKKLKDLEKELKNLKDENEKLDDENKEKDQKIEYLNDELNKLKKKAKKEIDKLTDDLIGKENELAEVNEQNGNFEVKLDELEKKIEDADEENEKLKKHIKDKDSIIDDLKAQINGLAGDYKELQDTYNRFYDETDARDAENLGKIEEAKKENAKILDALGASVILLHKINEASKRCQNCISDNMESSSNSSCSTESSSHSSSSSSSSSKSSKSSSSNNNNNNNKPNKAVRLQKMENKPKKKSIPDSLNEILRTSNELDDCLKDIISTKGETDLSKYAEQFYKATGEVNLDVPVLEDLLDFGNSVNRKINKKIAGVLNDIEEAEKNRDDFQNQIQEKVNELEDENERLRDDLNKIDKLTKNFHDDNINTAKKIKQEKGIDLTSKPILTIDSMASKPKKTIVQKPVEKKNKAKRNDNYDQPQISSVDNVPDVSISEREGNSSKLSKENSRSSSRLSSRQSSRSNLTEKSEISSNVENSSSSDSSSTSTSSTTANTSTSSSSQENTSEPQHEIQLEDYAALNEPTVVDRVGKALKLSSLIKGNILDQMKDDIDDLENDNKKLKDDINELKEKLEEQQELSDRLRSRHSALTIELQTSVSSASLFRKEVDRLITMNKQLKEKNQKIEEELAAEKLERRRVAESRLDLAQRKSKVEECMAECLRKGIKSCALDNPKSARVHVASPFLLSRASELMSQEEMRSIVGSMDKALNESPGAFNPLATSTYRTPRQAASSRVFDERQPALE